MMFDAQDVYIAGERASIEVFVKQARWRSHQQQNIHASGAIAVEVGFHSWNPPHRYFDGVNVYKPYILVLPHRFKA